MIPADTMPQALVAATSGRRDRVTVTFSEPVDPATYAIEAGDDFRNTESDVLEWLFEAPPPEGGFVLAPGGGAPPTAEQAGIVGRARRPRLYLTRIGPEH